MMIKATLGATIKKLRKDMGREWTQDKVAEAAGISTRYYQKLERGQKLPSIRTVFTLAKALGITPTELLEPSWEDWIQKQ